MKKFGLIGGVGPESTITYYRLIIKRFLEISESSSYPDFLIKNVNMAQMIDYVVDQDYDKLVTFLINATNDMEKAGIDFGAIASNTPHIVYDKLIDKINLPMISIVEESCKAAQIMNIKKIGLFGTKSTMTNGFYQKTAKRFGLEIIIPTKNQIDYIHDKYMSELIFNDIKVKTKDGLIKIVNDLQNKHAIQGLILGGTELSLILSQKDFENMHLLDSAIIHVNAIVDEMITN